MNLYVFSLVFALMGKNKGNFFLIAPQPYPRALRKSALLPLWRGRKHSLWYAHQNDPTAPAHPWAVHRLIDYIMCFLWYQPKLTGKELKFYE